MPANQYKTTLAFVDPAVLDGGITDSQLHQNVEGARRIAEFGNEADQEETVDALARGDADDHAIAAEAKHQSELDRIIATTPVKIGTPGFEQLASYRRSAVYAQGKLRAAVGGDPDENKYFLAPEEHHVPDPKPATGFVVAKARPRRPKNS